MDKLISLEQVSWTRQGQEILKNINWEVNQGEHWAVLGLNGSGKTSILNIVTGYHFPTSGNVKVLDTTFGEASIPKMRERIGFMSSSLEKFGATFNKQPVKNIVLSGKFSSVGVYSNQEILPEDHERADEILRNLRIEYLREKTYRYLSQGEKRRVLIGRALMNQPDLLIMDEPCSGLDILSREEVLDIMDAITVNHCHLVYVTHYIEEITEAITHVLLVKDGSIVAQGEKEKILTDDRLSETYKIPVSVRWEEKRPWITINRKK
ncbi:ABC transporter ATP-binding protein [Jeotgalibaca ciconiae]|uniref:ATP-binding cassette domain-containing protein n=1 Tax=Jeotgalibaca ciconiae TaxID=2496265 RepID=A0A3S9HDH1_9LACT|nr:ATP-binding cassette domain-containing protein [Jeotgalibaca ciconiae]AZP05394.1 ATP-binding cassette domain-containing protein [Jeotgalibaca ciconiae]HJB22732.1 ATP-binding cassette domain-containing protein [Candidatus Jeotgalibaca pullicola]